jgi:hypothetical protein
MIILLIPLTSLAFNDELTHIELTRRAISTFNSDINNYLGENLGIEKGTKKIIGDRTIKEWLEYGSEMEDDPPCRAANHFHNPSLLWENAGLSDHYFPVDIFCIFGDYKPLALPSNLTWATGFFSRSPDSLNTKIIEENTYDWASAREYFYIYLTGKDFKENLVVEDALSQEAYLAKSMQALGQVVHLLQDMAVPAHVRNDFSQGHTKFSPSGVSPKKWVCNRFEKYVKKNNTREWFDQIDKGVLPSPVLTDFWDTDSSDGIDTSTSSDLLGLAEYTHINFLSEYRMFTEKFPYPKAEHCEVKSYPFYDAIPYIKCKYISSTNGHPGDQINHLARVSFFAGPIQYYFPDNNASRHLPIIHDNNCYDEYASKLVPKAIGYSADLIDYFFRGKLQVSAIAQLDNDNISRFKLKIRNLTERQEELYSGWYTLVVRYTTWDGKLDGSDDIFVRSFIVPTQGVQYDQEEELLFNLYEPVPTEYIETIRCMLVFRGTLGNEKDAVIGKYFLPGEIKFLEAWDNGLAGNHPWFHSTDGQNYNNGATSNIIEDGLFVKDNIRYINEDKDRINESFIYFRNLNTPYEVIDLESPDGILITPNTYLQFKIDAFFINQSPPAPEGYTAAYQNLCFSFNAYMDEQVMVDYLELQYTQEGQAVNNPYINEVAYPFQLGAATSVNIYDAFQSQGITIPEPFYLQRIDLTQKLEDLEELSNIEHHQHMEIDFIGIIEGYSEPQ